MDLTFFKTNQASFLQIPLFLDCVKAGFPSPADDFIDKAINLNDYLISHPSTTFLVRVSGNSMQGLGIITGDVLVVDKSLTPVDGDVVVACINGDFTVKRLKRLQGKLFLVPANSDYNKIELNEEDDFQVWGVVTASIHNYKR